MPTLITKVDPPKEIKKAYQFTCGACDSYSVATEEEIIKVGPLENLKCPNCGILNYLPLSTEAVAMITKQLFDRGLDFKLPTLRNEFQLPLTPIMSKTNPYNCLPVLRIEDIRGICDGYVTVCRLDRTEYERLVKWSSSPKWYQKFIPKLKSRDAKPALPIPHMAPAPPPRSFPDRGSSIQPPPPNRGSGVEPPKERQK